MDAGDRARLRARVEAWRGDADGGPRVTLDPGALIVAQSLVHELLPLLNTLDAMERQRDAARAEAKRWLDKAAREREEADNAWAEAKRYRGLLQGVVRGDEGICECEGECFFCGGWVQDLGYEGHAADCPWIAAVVALAATEPQEA